jgi:hypothetical protein
MLRLQVGSASTEAREEGFLEAITKEFPAIKVISSNHATKCGPACSPH